MGRIASTHLASMGDTVADTVADTVGRGVREQLVWLGLLAMAVPVPMISFDNVLSALAIVLMTWGLRLRDGLLLWPP